MLKPDGIAHVSDSDWGRALLEPLADRFAVIMAAAGIAFRAPLVARRLYGLFRRSGFRDVRVRVLASADTSGAMLGVWRNMAAYAGWSGQLAEGEIAGFLDALDRAVEEQTYLALLPQFLVTGYR